MTITPRYTPSAALFNNEAEISTAHQNGWELGTFNAPTLKIQHPISFDITLNAGIPLASIDSHSHNIDIHETPNTQHITLQHGITSMDRDFTLQWLPTPSQIPRAALFTEQKGDDTYGLLMVVPPYLNETSIQPIAKEQIFIIDTSGSMGGVSIEQAKRSLKHGINALTSSDTFNIIAFESTHTLLFPKAVEATYTHIQRAMVFIDNLAANGGTEMFSALMAALESPPLNTDTPIIRQVIFITDGAVSNETILFNAIQKHLRNSRLFTVGIGAAPNSHFMRSAANFGRGTFTYIDDTHTVDKKMQQLLKQLSSPNMVNLSLNIPATTLALGNEKLPDLYAGQPLMLTFKLSTDDAENTLHIKGEMQQEPWEKEFSLSHRPHATSISTLWARDKIATLLDSVIQGSDAETVKKSVTRLALSHQLVSPYTSFIAVEHNITNMTPEKITPHILSNTIPAGSTHTYPRTATASPLHFLIACILGLLLWGVQRLPRDKKVTV